MAKPSSYIGVDFGSGGIKLIELANEDGRSRLLTYGYADSKPAGDSWRADKKETAKLLKKIYTMAKATTKQAVTGVPSQDVFSSVLTLPRVPRNELIKEIASKIETLTGQARDTLTLDWVEFPKKEVPRSIPEGEAEAQKAEDFIRILATAVPKTLVAEYTEIFSLAGLKLSGLETEGFALVRSLLGHDEATVLIIDIGAARTNVFIASRGLPILSRSIKSGGNEITEAIAQGMSVSPQDALRLKHDAAIINQFDETNSFPEIFQTALAPLTNEVKYFLDTYFETNRTDHIDRVILTGGTAHLPKLAEYIGKLFNLRVFRGDPWARVLHGDALRPVLDEIGPRFSVAIGLAMRDIAG